MAGPSSTFDAEHYKRTTTEQWQGAAKAWHDWGPVLETWLGEATERMLDLAELGPGSRVVDIAAGAGGQSIAAARRVGADGLVLATDISSNILDYAEYAAQAEGLSTVATKVVDGENLDVEAGRYDAAICRLGLIYFPDLASALDGIRRALRPGGRLAAIVYSTADRNQFFSIPVSLIRERAQLPPPAPGQPGPFSLGGDGVFATALEAAGFTDVSVEAVDAPLRMSSIEECLRFERDSFGALHQMLSGLDQAAQEQVWEEIATAFKAYETADGWVGPCELLVAGATKGADQ
jgi:SAM-dependent methyltransferase